MEASMSEYEDFIDGFVIAAAIFCDENGVHSDEDRQQFVDDITDALYWSVVEPYIAFGHDDE